MDKQGLIPIGRFAKLTDLSPRLLRKLDERGLLSPVLVDPETRRRPHRACRGQGRASSRGLQTVPGGAAAGCGSSEASAATASGSAAST